MIEKYFYPIYDNEPLTVKVVNGKTTLTVGDKHISFKEIEIKVSYNYGLEPTVFTLKGE
jgi:hypothetical protein